MSNVLLPLFRVSYPKVFKPELNKLSGKEEYSVVALFDEKSDFSAVKAEIKDLLTKKFGSDETKWPKNLKSPFRDQGERRKFVDGKEVMPAGHKEGHVFMNLKSKQRPGVLDEKKLPIMNEQEFYAGCFAIASVNPYYHDQAGNRGIALGLQALMKMKDGDPLSGRLKPEQHFDQVQISVDATTDNSATSLF